MFITYDQVLETGQVSARHKANHAYVCGGAWEESKEKKKWVSKRRGEERKRLSVWRVVPCVMNDIIAFRKPRKPAMKMMSPM